MKHTRFTLKLLSEITLKLFLQNLYSETLFFTLILVHPLYTPGRPGKLNLDRDYRHIHSQIITPHSPLLCPYVSLASQHSTLLYHSSTIIHCRTSTSTTVPLYHNSTVSFTWLKLLGVRFSKFHICAELSGQHVVPTLQRQF